MHDNLISEILNFKNKKIDPSIIDQNQVEKIIFYLLDSIKENIDGDVVEFGCYVGESSKYIMKTLLETKSNKKYYVYDSFEGLPDLSIWEKNTGWRPRTLKTTESVFVDNFETNSLPIPIIHKDWFCNIPNEKIPSKICFAFLDGDFYQSIYDSLVKIYDKVEDGGYILFHDYDRPDLPGVKAAIKDFFKEKKIDFSVIEITNQLGLFRKNVPITPKKISLKKEGVTLVTGFWDSVFNDIHNGIDFLTTFEKLLKTNQNMIIFGDDKTESIVKNIRNDSNTYFIKRSVEWFKQNHYFELITKITNNKDNLDLYRSIQLSKVFLLHDAKILDKFNSTSLYWVDFDIIDKIDLNESFVFDFNFIKRNAKYDLKKISNINLETSYCIYGFCFGGDKELITNLNTDYYQLLVECLNSSFLENEEFLLSIILNKKINYYILGNIKNDENHNNSEIRILVTTICFIDKTNKNSSDYVVSTHRLINDVITKTSYGIRIITNSINDFEFYKNSSLSNRISIIEDNLINDELIIGRFNQLLKYKVFYDIPNEYDWVLYLDCDAGIYCKINEENIRDILKQYDYLGYDFLGTRTHFTVQDQLIDHEENVKKQVSLNGFFVPYGENYNLFSPKFVYYNITSENINKNWLDAKLPDEHIFIFKNTTKTNIMGNNLKDFCRKYEEQKNGEIITISVESFEIGVSAKMAGYEIGNMKNFNLDEELNVVYNMNSLNK